MASGRSRNLSLYDVGTIRLTESHYSAALPGSSTDGRAEPHGSNAAAVLLRVTEARIEDIGYAICRVAPHDLERIDARAGDVLKITGTTPAVARAEISGDGQTGMVQVDGTTRSNCGAGLAEQV